MLFKVFANAAFPLTAILGLALGCIPAMAESRIQIGLDGFDASKLHETGNYSLNLKGTISSTEGLATVYTVDSSGIRGEVAFRLEDAQSGAYSFTAAPMALRPGLNSVTVVAVDQTNAASSVSLAVLSHQSRPQLPETRTGYWKGRAVTVQIKDGTVFYEGDIILGTVAEFERAQANAVSNSKNPSRYGLSIGFTSSFWPSVAGVAKVPYVITSGSANLTAAIASFNSTFSGIIQWTPRTAETDYVNINLNAADHSFACASSLGRTGGAQSITGSIDCFQSTLLHEMGHAIGLYHEHQRPDYSSFVTYNSSNIDAPIQPGNFGLETDNSQPVGLYDYSSIMHYGGFTFSKNNQPVLETIPAGMPIGDGSNFSSGDLDQVKRLYGAAPSQVTVTTNPPGLPILVDGVSYTAPQTFAWSIGSVHTIATPSGYQTTASPDGARYVFGNWNDSGAQAHSVTVNAGNGTRVAPSSSPAVTVYVASYQRYIPTTTQALGSGTILTSPSPTNIGGTNYYLERTAVTATASPTAGNVFFTKWYGDDYLPQGQNPKQYLIRANPYTIQAQFVTGGPIYTVNSAFTSNTPPNPTVTAIVDGSTTVLPYKYSAADGWTPGTSHTLNVSTPQSPVTTNIAYKFATWNFGASPTSTNQNITLAGVDTTYTATFKPSSRGYSIVSPSCAANAPNPLVTDQLYDDGSVVLFQVNPVSGWLFAGFSGSLTGLTNPQSLTVHDQFIVTANLNTVATPLTVTGVSPAGLPQGAATQMVTINGTGFTAASRVYVNGTWNSGRPVSFVDSQHLQVQLGPSDLTAPGGIGLGVANFVGGCSIFQETTFLINNPAGSPATVTANVNTTPQSAALNTLFANALAVTVRDAASNLLSGINVTFTAPGAGASGSFSNLTNTITVATNAAGVASAAFTANSVAGSYSVSATVSGVASPATFSLTNFVQTWSISGQITGASGVTVNLGGSQSGSTVTNGSGNYSFSGLAAGGSYTVTPSLTGFAFTPGFLTFNNLQTNQTTANFTATSTIKGDFDGNGHADLVWQSTAGSVVLWYMGTADGSVSQGGKLLAGDSAIWRVVAVADLNGDGKPDLIWQSTGGTVIVWYMGGADGSVVQSSKLLAGDSPTWRLAAVADLNGDGKQDLLWQSTAGSVVVWYMGGADGSVMQSGKLLAGDSAIWRLVAAADMDANGKADLIWQSTAGTVIVWYMSGADGSVVQSGKSLAGDSAIWKVAAAGDLDGNGKPDIIWQSTSGTVVVWYMSGADGSSVQASKLLAGDSPIWRVAGL